MKTFSVFIKKNTIKEGTIAFTFDNGGTDQTVLITGNSSELKKVEKRLPTGTKIVRDVPEDAWEISASEWLNLK